MGSSVRDLSLQHQVFQGNIPETLEAFNIHFSKDQDKASAYLQKLQKVFAGTVAKHLEAGTKLTNFCKIAQAFVKNDVELKPQFVE